MNKVQLITVIIKILVLLRESNNWTEKVTLGFSFFKHSVHTLTKYFFLYWMCMHLSDTVLWKYKWNATLGS